MASILEALAISDAETLYQETHPLIEEIAARPLRLSHIEVINARPHPSTPLPHFAPPGSITLCVARKGSGVLDELQAVLQEGGARATRFHDRLQAQLSARKQVSIPEAVQMLIREPVLAEVRYGGATIIQHFFVPEDLDMAIFVLPYNGGRLTSEGFTLVEHYQEHSTPALEAVAVMAIPPLTEAEKAALDQVPEDQITKNVGTNKWCDTTWYAVAILVAIAVVLGTVTITCASMANPLREQHLSPEALQRLSPAASAREILKLRQDILTEFFRK